MDLRSCSTVCAVLRPRAPPASPPADPSQILCNKCGLRSKQRGVASGLVPSRSTKQQAHALFGKMPSEEGRLRSGIAAWVLLSGRSLAQLARVRAISKAGSPSRSPHRRDPPATEVLPLVSLWQMASDKGRLVGSRLLVPSGAPPQQPMEEEQGAKDPLGATEETLLIPGPLRPSPPVRPEADDPLLRLDPLPLAPRVVSEPDAHLFGGPTEFLDCEDDEEADFSPFLSYGSTPRGMSPSGIVGLEDPSLRPCLAASFDYVTARYQCVFDDGTICFRSLEDAAQAPTSGGPAAALPWVRAGPGGSPLPPSGLLCLPSDYCLALFATEQGFGMHVYSAQAGWRRCSLAHLEPTEETEAITVVLEDGALEGPLSPDTHLVFFAAPQEGYWAEQCRDITAGLLAKDPNHQQQQEQQAHEEAAAAAGIEEQQQQAGDWPEEDQRPDLFLPNRKGERVKGIKYARVTKASARDAKAAYGVFPAANENWQLLIKISGRVIGPEFFANQLDAVVRHDELLLTEALKPDSGLTAIDVLRHGLNMTLPHYMNNPRQAVALWYPLRPGRGLPRPAARFSFAGLTRARAWSGSWSGRPAGPASRPLGRSTCSRSSLPR